MRKEKSKVAWKKQLKRGIKDFAEKTVLSFVGMSLIFTMCSVQFLFLGVKTAGAVDEDFGSGEIELNSDDVVKAGSTQDHFLIYEAHDNIDLPAPDDPAAPGYVKITLPNNWQTDVNCSSGSENVKIEDDYTSGAMDIEEISCSGDNAVEVKIKEMNFGDKFKIKFSNFEVAHTAGDYKFAAETKFPNESDYLPIKSKYNNTNIEVVAGDVDHYEFDTIGNQVVGVDFDVTVTAYDQYDNVTLGDASVDIDVKTGNGNLVPATPTADTSSDGEDTVTLHYDEVENSVVLGVDDGSITSNNSNSFNVTNISAPILGAPADESAINDPTPDFNWGTVAGEGVEYAFKLDTVNTFDSGNLIEVDNLTESEYTLTSGQSLGNDGDYFWKVEAEDVYDNNSGDSSIFEFSYQTTPPAAPNNAFVAGGENADDNPLNYINKYTTGSTTVTVEMDEEDKINKGSTVYVQLSDGFNAVNGSKTYTADDAISSFDVTGVNTNSLYNHSNIIVKARIVDKWGNQNVGGFVEGVSAYKDITPAGVPSLTAEPDTNVNTPSLEWSNVDEAKYYNLQLDDDADFSSVKIDEDLVESETNSYTTSALGDGTYYWRMRSEDIAWNLSNWSSSDSFLVDVTKPDSAVTTSGNYNAAAWSGDIEGTASDATAGVAFVEITLQRDSDDKYWDGSGWVAEANTWLDTGDAGNWDYTFSPTDGETYIVQSRAEDAVGNVQETLGTGTFTYDTTKPILSETTPVTTPTNDTTPSYTFNSTEAGAITYGGSCSSVTTTAVLGDNPINFNALAQGTYNNCTIKVTDAANNESDVLAVSEFVIDTTAPDAPTISIAGSSVVTTDSTPELTLATDGIDPDYMRFSCDESDWSAWIAWATTYSGFDITTGAGCSAGDGEKTVYIQGKDNAGNETANNSDSIIYDTDGTLTVDDSGGADFTTIQDAINNAQDTWTIQVAAGTYEEDLNFLGTNGIVLLGAKANVSAGVDATTRDANTTEGETIVKGTITTGSGTSGWPIGLTFNGLRFENTSFINAIRVQGDVIIKNSIIHFNSTYYLISVAGNEGTEHNLELINCNLTGERGFFIENGRIEKATISNNVFNTNSASIISASSLDGISTITNNEFNSPRGLNLLTNNNTITGNTFNIPAGVDNRGMDLYEVTGNTIKNNTFSSDALSIKVRVGGREEVSLNNTIESNSLLGGINNDIASKNVNAEENWWGSKQKSDVENQVSGNVTYEPWYLDAEMNTLSSSDTTSPTVVLSDDQVDNQVKNGDVVGITATFTDANGIDEGIIPTISITNGNGEDSNITNADMTKTSNLVWTYSWTVPVGNNTADVSVIAYDVVGNPNDPATTEVVSYTIDNTDPVVEVTSPDGGEYWASGSTQNITWTTAEDNKDKVTIDYSVNGTDWTNIATDQSDSGSYEWTLPSDVNSSSVEVRVTATDKAGNFGDDVSGSVFAIDSTDPDVGVTSPNGGEIWKSGLSQDITWNSSETNKDVIVIDYSTDNGVNWTSINVSGDNTDDGTFGWTVPEVDSSQVLVKVIATDKAGNSGEDMSNAVFTIDSMGPSISRTTIQAEQALVNGYLQEGDKYYIYAQVEDNLSGVNTVTGNFSNVTTDENSESLLTDEGPWTIGGQSYNYRSAQYTASSPLAEGVKNYTINADDVAGNNATQFTGTATVDNSAPNDASIKVYVASDDLTELTSGDWYNHSAPYATWSAPTENPASNNSGVAGYYICVDTAGSCDPSSSEDNFQTETNYTFSGLANGNSYYLRTKIKDNAGNISTPTQSAFLYKYDNENPDASGASVTDDGDWTNSTSQLHATWAGFTDNVGITLYEYSIGTSAGAADVKTWTGNGTNAEVTATALTLSSGTKYFFNVRAKDQATNTSNVFSSDGITVDSQAPTGTAASSIDYSNSTFTVSWAGATEVGPSGLSGDYKVKYKDQTDGAWTDWLVDTTDTTDTFDLLALVSGHTYYFEAGAEDNAGNWETFVGGSGETATVYDKTAPENPTVNGYENNGKTTSLLTNNWYNYTAPYFEWSAPQDLPNDSGLANSGIAEYQIYFGTASDDGTPSGDWQASTSYTVSEALTSGETYYLRVKTKDNAGNISLAETVFTYKYDEDAPDNPAVPVSGWESVGKNVELTSGNWYNYTNPRFEWVAPSDNPEGDSAAGVRGYLKYFGTSDSGNPTGNYGTGLTFTTNTISDSGTKYLRIKTVDSANLNSDPSTVDNGNIADAVTAFTYNFDEDAPTTSVISATPNYDSGSQEYIKGDVTIAGTSADTGGSGVSRTDVQIKDATVATPEYWNGTAWTTDETWINTEDTTSWNYTTSSLNLTGKNGNTLEIRSKAYDSVNGGGDSGNAATSSAYSVIVDVDQPVFGIDNTVDSGTTGDSFTFSQDVIDGESGVSYVQVEYWYGDGGHTTTAMTNSSSKTYTKEITLPSDSLDTLHYLFKSQDNVENTENTTATSDVTISDNDTPVVDVITKDINNATAGKTVTIEAGVTDNIGVDDVTIYYRNFGGSWNTKAMARTSGDDQDGIWEVTIDVQQSTSGQMNYYVVADDDAGNDDTDDNSGNYYDIDVQAGALDQYEVYSDTDPITSGSSFIITVIAKDEFNNNVNNSSTANIVVQGWDGSSYVNLDPSSYDALPPALTFTNNSVLSTNITITGEGSTSYTNIRVLAIEGDGTSDVNGYTDLGATNFNATVAGAGINGGDGGTGVEGAKDGEQPVATDGGKSADQKAGIPWGSKLPYALTALGALAFVGFGIKWWMAPKGPGGKGGANLLGMLFSTLKTAAVKIKMFLW